jgi:hypothetical protein
MVKEITMRTLKCTVYNYKELSEEAKLKALEHFADINVDGDFWYEYIFDDAKEVGKILGIDIKDIYFSGFSSQGDGACFIGDYEYNKGCVKALKAYAPQDAELHKIAKGLQAIQKTNFYKLHATIEKASHHYSHERTVSIRVMNRVGDWVSESIENDVAELLRDLMRWIYDTLEKEYEFQTSREQIEGTIEANDFEFLSNGSLPRVN